MIRKWITLVESLHDSGRIESPNQFDLEPEEDIDYENNWEEILEWPDTDSSVPVEQQIQNALHASGAVERKLPNGSIVYVTDDKIIILNNTGADVEDKDSWIWDIDPSDYFPNYENEWNNDFWANPIPLYHATTDEKIEEIQQDGIVPMNKTRGLSNRSVGAAVFTTSEYEEAMGGSYGNHIFEINTEKMKQQGNQPYVSEEPPIMEAELRSRIAHYIGMEDFDGDVSSDMSPYTIIVYGSIPPDCLTLLD